MRIRLISPGTANEKIARYLNSNLTKKVVRKVNTIPTKQVKNCRKPTDIFSFTGYASSVAN